MILMDTKPSNLVDEIHLAEPDPINQASQSRPRWYLPVAIILSLIFLYLAMRGIQWDAFLNSILNCRFEYLIPAIAISLVSYFVRSQRWGILLRGNKSVNASILFWAMGIGYLGNNFLPFRTGDVLRSIALGFKTGLNKVYVFATTLTERVMDALFLIVLGLLIIPSIGSVPSWLPPVMQSLGILSFVAVVFLLIAPRLEGPIRSFLYQFPLPGKWQSILSSMLGHFLQGAASFQNPGRSALFLLLTCLIWLLDGLGVMFSARSFSMEISLNQALLLLVGLGLSSAIPSAPGYIGVYQYVAVTILAIYGYPKSQALAFILVAQAIGMLLTLIWGLVGLGMLGINRSELRGERNNLIDNKGDIPDV